MSLRLTYTPSESPLLITTQANMELNVPVRNINSDTVEVKRQQPGRFEEWSLEDQRDAYDLLQKVSRVWENPNFGFSNYAFYGSQEKNDQDFSWYAIPYSNWFTSISQLKTLYYINNKRVEADQNNRTELQSNWKAKLASLPAGSREPEINLEAILLRPDRLAVQKIWEGQHSYLLYNYNPIKTGTAEEFQVLIVSKAGKIAFRDLSEAESLEISSVTKAIFEWAKAQPNFAALYMYENSGTKVQSVQVFHRHLIMLTDQDSVSQGVRDMAKKFVYSPPLLDTETKRRAQKYSEILKPYLSHIPSTQAMP